MIYLSSLIVLVIVIGFYRLFTDFQWVDEHNIPMSDEEVRDREALRRGDYLYH